jgi:hypothetical protein
MTWYNGVALAGLLVGFIGGLTNFKSLRTAPKDSPVLVAWEQSPAPWRYEGTSYLVIAIHSLGMVLLGGLLLLVFNLTGRVPALPFLEMDQEKTIVLILIALFPLFQAGLAWGITLAFPVGSVSIRPVPYAIAETGIRYGRARLPWKLYSHYESDSMTGVTLLYSASSPALPNAVLIPPPELNATVIEHVRKNLPAQPPLEMSWHRAPWVLVAGMGLLTLAFLLPGLWLVRIPSAWPYYFVAVFLFQDLGMRWIYRFDPSGKPVAKAGNPTETSWRK